MSFAALLLHLQPDERIPAASSRTDWRGDKSGLPEWQADVCRSTSLIREVLREDARLPDRIRLAALLDERRQLCLRITVLGEDELVSLPHILEVLSRASTWCVGEHKYAVSAIDVTGSPWTGLSTWADFLAPASGQMLRLHLGTPLVLPCDPGAPHGNRFHFPVPLALFADLAHRWQALGGPPLPVGGDALPPILEDGTIAIADHRLISRSVCLFGHVHMGLLGRIYYRCRKASAAYTTLVALTRFAFFAGVGAFTEVGMGTTRITIG